MKSAITILVILLVIGLGVVGYLLYDRQIGSVDQNTNQVADACAQNVSLQSQADVEQWIAYDRQCRGTESVFTPCRQDVIISSEEDHWRLVCSTFDGTLIQIVGNMGQPFGEPVFIQTN